MKQYPGEKQTVTAILNAYRSMQKDFRSDMSRANVQHAIAPLAAELKQYSGKNPNNLPDDYADMLTSFPNKLHSLMGDLDKNSGIYRYLSSAASLLTNVNSMLGRAMYNNQELPLESVCHNIDAAYINIRNAMELS